MTALFTAAVLLLASSAAPQDALTFGARTGVVLNFVKADRAEPFEAALDHLRKALAASDNPIRRQQAEGWRFFRAAEAGPGGTVVFVFAVDPVLRGADYSVKAVLEDALPEDEARRIAQQFADSLATPQLVLNLELIAELPPPTKPAPRRK